jgi:hypothetical protein
MAARPRSVNPAEGTKSTSLAIGKGVGRAYAYWAVGVMISALSLKPTSINAAGVSLSIEHPEVIQGVLYLAAFIQCIGTLTMLQKGVNPYASRSSKRTFLWGALPKGTRSFRGMKREDFVAVRKKARLLIGFMSWLFAVPLVFLILVLMIFKWRAIGSAIGAFFVSGL